MRWMLLIFLLAVALSAPKALKVKLRQPTPQRAEFASYPGLSLSVLAWVDLGLLCYYAFSVRWLAPIGVIVFVVAIYTYLDYEDTHQYLPRRSQEPNLTWPGVVMLVVLVHIAAIMAQYVHPDQAQSNLRTPTPTSSFQPPHGVVWPPEPAGKSHLTVS